jgi:hypothetical protein
MTAKKKVDDEAGDTAPVVDEEAVEAPDVEGAEPVEESTPVEVLVDGALATAQKVLGVPSTGKQDHATKMALRKFQREHRLSPTGQLDDLTKARLGI